MRLALKASIPYFVTDGSVHFRRMGELTSLEDPDGSVLALLRLLDGTRDATAISAELRARFGALTDAEVRAALDDLDQLGLLQDATDQGLDFDDASRERWSNNLGFFESYATLTTSKYEFQRRIRNARVAVLGLGGVGSHVLLDLIAIGFEDIRIVDFDRVELSNLNRQILYGEQYLGRPKVEVAAERARAMNSQARIDPVQHRLSSAEDVYRLVQDRDIVLALADRPRMQIGNWLNEGCVRAGAAVVNCGVDVQRAYHFTVLPGISGCLQCWQNAVSADPTTQMVLTEFQTTEQQGRAFGESTAAFNGLVLFGVSYVVAEMVRLASRVGPPLSVGRELDMTFHDPRLREVESWKRDPDCAVCRHAVPRPGLEWLASANGPLPF